MKEKTLPNMGESTSTPAPQSKDEPKETKPEAVDLSKEADEIISEADKILQQDPGELTSEEDPEDQEYVRVKKSDLEKHKGALKNYGTGLKTLKQRAETLKTKKPEETPVEQPVAPKAPAGQQEDFLTKGDFYKANQKKAIAEATKNTEINDNWDEIVKYFKPTRSQDVVENIVADIDDAYTLWQKHEKKDQEGQNRNGSELGHESSRQTGDSGNQGGDGTKKSIMPKKTPIQDWYPSDKK